MKIIQNDKLLNQYLAQYQIESLFDTKPLPFRVCEYERGEIISFIKDANSFLQFLVSGTIQIYAIRKDGSRYFLCEVDHFTLLGDMEFCGEDQPVFLVEASKKVTCIELPLYHCRTALLNDNTFLRYLLRSISHKLALFSQTEASFSSLEEKLLHYIKYDCPDQQFQGVGTTSAYLHCSRRQLQRLLKSLTERRIIEKICKGTYRLNK